MPLTPNNREEHWLQGMVDGQTTLEPNKRREYWYKEIVDAIGSGGGGGATVLTATVSNGTATLPCTAAELYALIEAGMVIVKYSYTSDGLLVNVATSIINSSYAPDGTEHGIPAYLFQSNAFEINCAAGTDIPTFSIG